MAQLGSGARLKGPKCLRQLRRGGEGGASGHAKKVTTHGGLMVI
jgi:hypothetical protein